MSLVNTPVRILDLTPVQLKEFLKFLGEPVTAADRILKYIYREYVAGFDDMTDLSPTLREKLAQSAIMGVLELVEELAAVDGQTRKVLFRLADNNTVESALMFFAIPAPDVNGALFAFPARLVALSAVSFARPDSRGLYVT